jgi:hypothetical protein
LVVGESHDVVSLCVALAVPPGVREGRGSRKNKWVCVVGVKDGAQVAAAFNKLFGALEAALFLEEPLAEQSGESHQNRKNQRGSLYPSPDAQFLIWRKRKEFAKPGLRLFHFHLMKFPLRRLSSGMIYACAFRVKPMLEGCGAKNLQNCRVASKPRTQTTQAKAGAAVCLVQSG